MLQFQACDHTQERWLTCFGDVGDEIMGCNANEFKRYENTPDMDHVLGTAQFQRWLFTLKVAEDTYNDETRVKVTVQRVSKPDYRQEGEQRAKDIQDLLQGGGLPTNAHHDGGAYHNQKKPRTHEYGVGGGAGGYGGQAYAAGGGGGGYGGGGYGGGGYGGGGHGGGGYGGSGYGGGGIHVRGSETKNFLSRRTSKQTMSTSWLIIFNVLFLSIFCVSFSLEQPQELGHPVQRHL